MRAVIDTSVWVSAILNPSGPPARVLNALVNNQFSLVISDPLLAELAEVMTRPRLVQRYNLTPEKTHAVLLVLQDGELTAVTGSVRVCRDPDDDMVIGTATNGHADVLVSRDDELKRSPEVAATLSEHGIQVLSIQHSTTPWSSWSRNQATEPSLLAQRTPSQPSARSSDEAAGRSPADIYGHLATDLQWEPPIRMDGCLDTVIGTPG